MEISATRFQPIPWVTEGRSLVASGEHRLGSEAPALPAEVGALQPSPRAIHPEAGPRLASCGCLGHANWVPRGLYMLKC